MNKRIIVIAGNFQQFQLWRRDHPEIAKLGYYADHPSDLVGLSPDHADLVYYGEYWLNPLNGSTELLSRGFLPQGFAWKKKT